VSSWPSTKARKVLKAIEKIGWEELRRTGSHRVLRRTGWPNYVFAFHEGDEIGSRMMARIGKYTGLTPEDL